MSSQDTQSTRGDTFESIKQKALKKFHDNHDDGDVAIYEMFTSLQQLQQRENEKMIENILEKGQTLTVPNRVGNTVPWWPDGLWRYLHDLKSTPSQIDKGGEK